MSRQRDRLAALRRQLEDGASVSFVDRREVERANETALAALPVDESGPCAVALVQGLVRLTEMVGFEQACRLTFEGTRSRRR